MLAQKEYHDPEIQAATPYLAVDVEFNAILAASDVSLASMAKVLQLHSSVRLASFVLSCRVLSVLCRVLLLIGRSTHPCHPLPTKLTPHSYNKY